MNKDTASGMRSCRLRAPVMLALANRACAKPEPLSVLGHITKARVREVPGGVMPWELKVKKGPPKPSRGMAFPSMPGSGHQRVKRKLPSGHHSSRPLGGRLSGLETAGFGGGLQEPGLWAPETLGTALLKRSKPPAELSFCKRQG